MVYKRAKCWQINVHNVVKIGHLHLAMPPAYRSITKYTTFRLKAPEEAKDVRVLVCLIKDDAEPVTRSLRKGVDGVWSLRMELARGRYVYRFLVDGTPTLDSSARMEVEDDQGGKWSMREIGH
jgi:hypothetical protein